MFFVYYMALIINVLVNLCTTVLFCRNRLALSLATDGLRSSATDRNVPVSSTFRSDASFSRIILVRAVRLLSKINSP